MHRYLLLLSLLLLGGTLFAAAAEDNPIENGPIPITVPRDGEAPGVFGPLQRTLVPVELERMASAPAVTLVPSERAADLCSQAAPLLMADGTDGDRDYVDQMTRSDTDPRLGCMSGNPQSLQGYRTVWYRFEAPASGRLVAYTDFDPSNYRNSYDTVLALFHSSVKYDVAQACNNLEMVACNDDSAGFLSKVNVFVEQGEWYFIEVAAWHQSAEGYEMQLAVVLENAESFWQPWQPAGTGDGWFWKEARSRHMVVTDGRYIFIISGETVVEEQPERTPNVTRLDPVTGDWDTDLFPVTYPALPGYSRTSAAALGDKIYLPAGYVGDDQFYAGVHLRYNITINRWDSVAPVPWNIVSGGDPYAWSQALAAPSQNGYYLVGGLLSGEPDPSFPSDAQPTGHLLFYSVPANSWNTQLPDMNTARYAHVAALLNSPQGRLVCVAGGIGKISDNEAVLLNSAECYNLSTNSWSEIAPLNRARFSAGSAVGPDGRWYVFGGATVTESDDEQVFAPETITEVYDPATNSWTSLDSRYSLDEPGRAWPRGVFVGDTLWIFGGETVGTDPPAQVVPLIQRLTSLPPRPSIPIVGGEVVYLPVTARPRPPAIEPNNTFATALPIDLYEKVQGDFGTEDDFFDVYRFRVTTGGVHVATVTSIPRAHNYDVYLYNENKYRVGFGEAIGNQDEVARTSVILTPGTYYAVVVRVFGDATTDDYNLTVRPE